MGIDSQTEGNGGKNGGEGRVWRWASAMAVGCGADANVEDV